MTDDLGRALARALRRLARHRPGGLVLRATGEPVEPLAAVPGAGEERLLVATSDGEVRLLRPADLASRPRLDPEAPMLLLALVLAAAVAFAAALAGR